MKTLKILQIGGGWSLNIGNAFIDFGSMKCLSRATNDMKAEVHLTSTQSRWAFHYLNRNIINWLTKKPGNSLKVFNIQQNNSIDYLVMSGACLSRYWFEEVGEALLNLKNAGARIIINGGGITEKGYSKKEIEITRGYLKELKPFAFISRDEVSFEGFKDLAPYSYNGIDCGLFVNEHFRPIKFDMPEYIVINFDRIPEPRLEKLGLDKNNYVIVRSHNAFWYKFPLYDYFKMKNEYFGKNNIMISEVPEDYLNLYANSSGVFTDRVHTCVAALTYGKSARLFSDSPRALLFERVGVPDINKERTKIDLSKLDIEKQKQVDFLKEIFNIKP